jgi:hypothetical protein
VDPKQDQKKQQQTTPAQVFEMQKDAKTGKKVIKKT